MFRSLAKLCANEDGAITIDWVVLTSFLAFMAGVIALYIAGPVKDIDTKNGAILTDVATQIDGTKISVKFSK